MISLGSEADSSIQSRTFKADDNSDRTGTSSPGSFDSCSIASKLDNLVPPGAATSNSGSPVGGDDNNQTPPTTTVDGQKSPVQRLGVSVVGSNVLAEMKAKQEKRTSGLFSSSTTATNSNSSSVLNKFKQSEEKESVTVMHSSLKTETTKSSTIVNVNMNSSSVSSSVVTNSASSGGNISSGGAKIDSSSSVPSVTKTKEHFSNKNSIVANAAAALNANSASNVNKRPPPVAPKPRPWSVLGSDRRSG